MFERSTFIAYLSVIVLCAALGFVMPWPKHQDPWHYEKTKSTKDYDYWTNSAGEEILVIRVHHKK